MSSVVNIPKTSTPKNIRTQSGNEQKEYQQGQTTIFFSFKESNMIMLAWTSANLDLAFLLSLHTRDLYGQAQNPEGSTAGRCVWATRILQVSYTRGQPQRGKRISQREGWRRKRDGEGRTTERGKTLFPWKKEHSKYLQSKIELLSLLFSLIIQLGWEARHQSSGIQMEYGFHFMQIMLKKMENFISDEQ